MNKSNMKKKLASVRLTDKEYNYLESKIEIKEMFLQGVCKVPYIKISPSMILREILWLKIESEGVSWQ